MRLRRRGITGPFRRLTEAALNHPLLDYLAIICHTFKQDPVAMLKGDDYDFAIRYAVAKRISAAKMGEDIEEMLDD